MSPSTSLRSLLLPVVLLACACVTEARAMRRDGEAQAAVTPQPKYLVTFGDSYSQTGFNISLAKPSASNPLGNPPLPGWTSSGGLNWIGFLASQLNTSLVLAYNFAYGGATTDAELVEPYSPEVLSLVDQVALFSGSLGAEPRPEYAAWTSEDTLFGVWIGVNDVGNTYWKSNVTEITSRIMDRYFAQLQIMYDAGARNFVLLNVPPTDRTPNMIAQGTTVTSLLRAVIEQYNDAVVSRLAAFVAKNAGVDARIVDTHPAFNAALDDPTAYGAPDALCYNPDGTSCLWFNDYHPGVAIQGLVGKAVADAWNCTFF